MAGATGAAFVTGSIARGSSRGAWETGAAADAGTAGAAGAGFEAVVPCCAVNTAGAATATRPASASERVNRIVVLVMRGLVYASGDR